MIAYIPTSSKNQINREVYNSLATQEEIEFAVIVVSSDFRPVWDKDRYRMVAENKARIFYIAKQLNEPFFFVSNDSLVYHEQVMRSLINFMVDHPMCGAVALNHGKENIPINKLKRKHVEMGSVIFRTFATNSVKWDQRKIISGHYECECKTICREMRKDGWVVRYLDGRAGLVEEKYPGI